MMLHNGRKVAYNDRTWPNVSINAIQSDPTRARFSEVPENYGKRARHNFFVLCPFALQHIWQAAWPIEKSLQEWP